MDRNRKNYRDYGVMADALLSDAMDIILSTQPYKDLDLAHVKLHAATVHLNMCRALSSNELHLYYEDNQ
jgi:hypothetical protein